MRIVVHTDLRYTTRPHPTGVDKHIEQMVGGLARTPGMELSLLAASNQENRNPVVSTLPIRRLPFSWRTATALWTVFGRPVADRWLGPADWVYCPRNDWIPVRCPRYAVTIHGAPELDPELPPLPGVTGRLWALRNRVQYRRMCCRADVVLTVSEFLKRRIVEQFGVAPERVAVVGNGVETAYFEAGQEPCRPATEAPYLLAVGGLNFLDGGDRVIALARELRQRRSDLRIRVAGCQHAPGQVSAARMTGAIDFLGYLPAGPLARQMRGAEALYFPTRYETFGLAAAEAMAVGTPVVTCRSTAMPEIVGEAGLYVPPDDAGATADAVAELRSDSELRARLVARGRLRAATYTWTACVRRLHGELTRRM